MGNLYYTSKGIFITGFRVVMISENLNVNASFAGKLKTAFQMTAIGFLIMEWIGGEILLYIALILTLYSGFEYIYTYIKAQKKEKNEIFIAFNCYFDFGN